MSSLKPDLAFIGGSGVYNIEGLDVLGTVQEPTPYGPTSDPITVAQVGDRQVAFLPRHGRNHRHLPSEVPYRANIFALKTLGIDKLVAISAVGSLKLEIEPRSFVVPDQLIDRTRLRSHTFFGDGIVAHVAFADPFCPTLSEKLTQIGRGLDMKVRERGTWVVIEGPAFSTRAESRLYQSWGADIIGMTAVPEAKLAREAEIAYAALAMVTDYDCLDGAPEEVSADAVAAVMQHNTELARDFVTRCAHEIPRQIDSVAYGALGHAIMTSRKQIPAETRERLAVLISKYLEP